MFIGEYDILSNYFGRTVNTYRTAGKLGAFESWS